MQKKHFERRLHTTAHNFSCLLRSQIIFAATLKFVLPLLFLVWLQAVETDSGILWEQIKQEIW